MKRPKNPYNGTKLLNLKDLSGEHPEIFMVCGNRSAGKTYFFKRMLLRRFIKTGEPFIILCRWAYEIDDVGAAFFPDIAPDFPDVSISFSHPSRSIYGEVKIEKDESAVTCGYVLPLNSADALRKISGRFVDATAIFFDEFQSESGKYCPKELEKFQSIHISLARGGGSYQRYLPVYMCSNAVTLLNPYFAQFGIPGRLSSNTKFLRGQGWVLEMTFNSDAADAVAQSGFSRAFASSSYSSYAQYNTFLLDNNSFIEKPHGERSIVSQYCVNGHNYGLWVSVSSGVFYFCNELEPSWGLTFSVHVDDHSAGTILLPGLSENLRACKRAFEAGSMRFENLMARQDFLDMVGLVVIK